MPSSSFFDGKFRTMSQVLLANAAATLTAGADRLERPRSRGSVILWGVLASLALIGSGFIRDYQTQHYQEENTLSVASPFPLKGIPQQLEGWHLVDGSATVLDPLTTRITGSVDHIIGNYINEQTGVIVTLLALFGPAEPMTPHTPEVCYPSSGFKLVGGIVDGDLTLSDQTKARFRSDIFAKSGGRSMIQEMVYHSFRHDGVWVPVVNTRNSPRKNPAVYKIQVVRRMASGETRGDEEPIEGFLKKMIPELERMIASAGTAVDEGGPLQIPAAAKAELSSPIRK